MKLCQNVNSPKTKSGSKLGHVGSKTRSIAQIMKKPCVHSRGQSFDQKFTKLCQDVSSYKILVNFEALKFNTCGNADSGVSQFFQIVTLHCPYHFYANISRIQGAFNMNCLLSSSCISMWGPIKTNTYLKRVIQYLQNGVSMYMF